MLVLGVTHFSVVMEMRDICESGPGNLNMQVKVCCNTLCPFMCLLCMRPWDELDGSSSLQPHICTPSFCTHQAAALHNHVLLLFTSVLLTQWCPACSAGKLCRQAQTGTCAKQQLLALQADRLAQGMLMLLLVSSITCLAAKLDACCTCGRNSRSAMAAP